jgi:hypothetical protein
MPAGTSPRPSREPFQHPVDERVVRVQHRERRLVLGAAALGGDGDVDLVAGDELDVHDGRRVVAGVLPEE